MKLRFKLGMMILAFATVVCGGSALSLGVVAVDERTTLPLSMVWVIFSAFVIAAGVLGRGIWKISRYVKSVDDKLVSIREGSDRSHLEAQAANSVAVAANLEAKLARAELQESISRLPCRMDLLPKLRGCKVTKKQKEN